MTELTFTIMNANVQGLNFLDVTSLDPQEQQRVNEILFGQRDRVLGKVEFPWGNTQPRRHGEGDEGAVSSPDVPIQRQTDPSLPQTDRQIGQDMSSIPTDRIEFNNVWDTTKPKERNVGKPYERRNKKRRPPDYYQKLEEAIQLENSIQTESAEASRPLMWHEEVEQTMPLVDNPINNVLPTGNISSLGNLNPEPTGALRDCSYSAQTGQYPQHQNFSANFQGNDTVDELISKQPEFIPNSRSSDKTYNDPNFSQWQQPTQMSGNTYDISSKQSVPLSQFSVSVSNYDPTLCTNVSSPMHFSGPPHKPTNFSPAAPMMSHGVSYPRENKEIISANTHPIAESEKVGNLSEHISRMSVEQQTQHVPTNLSDISSSSYPGSGANSSVIQPGSDSFSFVPSDSSQRFDEEESKNNMGSVDSPLTFDFDRPRTDLDFDQYPVLGKISGSSEDTTKDAGQGFAVQSTSPLSVPPQAAKPKSASWAGLFSNVDPAKQGFVVTNWSQPPTNDPPKPTETPQTETREPSAPVTVSEDPLAKTFGDSLSRMKVSHVPIGLQPRGLMNRGNWCYINATLQALVSCPPFYNVMKKFPVHPPVRKGKSCTPIMDSIVQFVHEFHPCGRPTERGKKTLTDLATGPAFEPANVYRMLQVMEANKSFKLGRQEDAEEFLSCILDGLHEEMTTLIKFAKGTLTDPNSANGSVMEDVSVEESSDNADSWEQVGPKKKSVLTRRATFEKTPLAEIFVGYTRSALYKASSKDSATLQPFFTLQLDIQSDKVHSVKEALEGLVSRESVSGFTCSKTKAEVDVVRHLTLEELPPVLILHLKFFVYDKDGGSQKVLKNLEYGIDLEITKDLLSPNVRNKLQLHQRSYKLFAVVYHHGKKATGGHYTTAVFHPAVNNWIMMDDSLVKHVSVGTVLKNFPGRVPYLLYYRRVDMH